MTGKMMEILKLTWGGYYDGTEETNSAYAEGAKLMSWGGSYIILQSNDSRYVLYDLEVKEIVPQLSTKS